MQDQQPIPQFTRYACGGCGKQAVAQKGAQMLCETCVNTFLAKNVGMMREVPEPEPEPEVRSVEGEVIN